MSPIAGTVTSVASSIISNFSPARSPFYGVIAFGTVALCLSAENIDAKPWLAIAIPIYIVLLACVVLAIRNPPDFEPAQAEDQLRFARSLSLSSAMLALVLTARVNEENDLAFWVNYGACMAQTFVFLGYIWARSMTKEEHRRFNFVQFTLITTALLAGASYCNAKYATNIDSGEEFGPVLAAKYLTVGGGLYLLWLNCLVRWIRHVSSLIKIPETNGNSAAQNGAV